MRSPNLATRPFRNERLPRLILAVLTLGLVALSVRHALLVRALLPDRTSVAHRQVADLEQELRKLRDEAGKVPTGAVPAPSIEQWTVLADLVDRRTFSWSTLLATLEEVAPRRVRLVSVAPKVTKGDMSLEINAMAESTADGLEFIVALESREEFSEVYPLSRVQSERGTEFTYRMKYEPRRTPPSPESVKP